MKGLPQSGYCDICGKRISHDACSKQRQKAMAAANEGRTKKPMSAKQVEGMVHTVRRLGG